MLFSQCYFLPNITFFIYCYNVTVLHMSRDNNIYNKYTKYKMGVNDSSSDVIFLKCGHLLLCKFGTYWETNTEANTNAKKMEE